LKKIESLIFIKIIVCTSIILSLFLSAAIILNPTNTYAAITTAPASISTTESSDKSLSATLNRISAAAAGVNTISSRMVQEKHLSAFSEVIKTSGHFAFKRPDCWRWELTKPVASGIMVCGDHGRRWHENGGAPQSFKLADEPWLQHFATQITAWTTADFTFLKEQYDLTQLTQNPPTLKLVPKEAAARRLISALEITFSADYRYVVKIIIRESGSDYTTINFRNVHINTPLPQDYFK
jgi:outer membrane lipoprotein carrier protein